MLANDTVLGALVPGEGGSSVHVPRPIHSSLRSAGHRLKNFFTSRNSGKDGSITGTSEIWERLVDGDGSVKYVEDGRPAPLVIESLREDPENESLRDEMGLDGGRLMFPLVYRAVTGDGGTGVGTDGEGGMLPACSDGMLMESFCSLYEDEKDPAASKSLENGPSKDMRSACCCIVFWC